MKKGVMEISFGMIFSVIIIIAIIGVGVYAITTFLQIGKSTQIGLFHEKFSETVEEIWASAITNRVVSFSISNSIEYVCFGSLESGSGGRYAAQFTKLREHSSGFEQQNTNMFLYPPDKAEDFAYKKAEKVDLSSLGGFDCFSVEDGIVRIRLSKNEFDSLVKVQHE